MLQSNTLQMVFKKLLPLSKSFLIITVANVLFTIFLWKFVWPERTALLHTLLELVCIFIATATFLVSWHNTKNTTVVNEIVGLGYLVIAIFGILHIYNYFGLGLYPKNYVDLSTRYGVLKRLSEALVLYTITLNKPNIKFKRWVALALSLTLSIGVSVLLFLYPGIMPVLIIDQEVTQIKIVMEYIIILSLIVVLLRLKSREVSKSDLIAKKYLYIAIIYAIISGIFLTLFESFSSFYFLSAHIFSVTSYFYIFKGIFMSSITYPYKKLEEEVEVRRRAEEKLRFSEERFFKAFYASPDIMSITNIETREYLDVNESFLKTFGYIREEVIGRKPTELIIEPEIYENLLKEIREKGKVNNKEMDYHNKYGEPVKLLVSYEPIKIQETNFLLAAAKDVTEILRLKREMERLDRLKLVGQMSASISHEVRNPLTTVRGFLQMLQINEIDEKRKEYFDITIEELDRCNSIITEFLSLARDKSIDLKYLSLNQIIESIYPLVLADAVHLGIDIKFEEGSIPHLLLDENEIRQLILNLTRNGLEAMTSGVLTIKTYFEDGETVVSVQDQGTGIEAEVLEKLGTPFVTTKESGSGLGLAVCYNIAYRHNAIVDVQTGKDGTTFFIKFSSNNNPQNQYKAS